MNRDKDKIDDMKNSIYTIKSYLAKLEFYELDDIQRFGILYLLQIMGEAANLISDNIKNQYPNIKWREIIAFRNFVVHQYMSVKWEIVERVIKNDLPLLEAELELIEL